MMKCTMAGSNLDMELSIQKKKKNCSSPNIQVRANKVGGKMIWLRASDQGQLPIQWNPSFHNILGAKHKWS